MTLGAKRNFMHEKARGEFLVYMDDDDYYPPCRIRHAIETLRVPAISRPLQHVHHRNRFRGGIVILLF